MARGITQTRKLLLKAADIEKMTQDCKVYFLNPNVMRINFFVRTPSASKIMESSYFIGPDQ
jgi:hypothetical protein